MRRITGIICFLAIGLVLTGHTYGQTATPTLTWRVSNPYLEHIETTSYLVFDIDLKASDDYYYYSGECIFNLNFDEDVFSLVNTEYKFERKGVSSQMAGTERQYTVTINVNPVTGGHNLYIALTPNEHTYFHLDADSWETYITIKAPITDEGFPAGLTFRLSQMNGNNSWEENQDAGGQFEDLVINDFADLYIGRIFSTAGGGWTQFGGTLDWTEAVNTSIWDGSATLDDENAHTNHLRLHTFDDPVNGETLAGLYIEPNAALTVEGDLDANNNAGKNGFRAGKDDAVVIAKWDFEDEGQTSLPYTADDGIEANEDAKIRISQGSVHSFQTLSGGSRSPIQNNFYVEDFFGDDDTYHYWYAEFSTSGYEAISLSSQQWSAITGFGGNGPTEFIVEWSTDGTNWSNPTFGSLTVPISEDWTTGVIDNLSFSDLDNRDVVYVRWKNNDARTGFSSIDNIIITGEPLPTYSGIHIASDETGKGSLIHNTEGLSAIIERYIPPPSGTNDSWDDNYGWHLLSSPVSGQAIDDFTVTPPEEYDFYLWSEEDDLWINFKGGSWNTHNTDFSGASADGYFAIGRGYLVAYKNEQEDFFFEGELNVDDITWSDLSLKGDGVEGVYAHGWHLLGNPFSSAIELKDNMEAWNLDEVSPTVKIWEEAGRAYLDVSSDLTSNFIPAAQGFFVQVNVDGDNSITIPASERSHQTDIWYKNQDVRGIFLVARESDKQHGQTKNIVLAEGASQDFDFFHDSRFIGGHAPQFYSIFGQEVVSTKRLPEINSGTVIQLGFVKNTASEFSIDLLPQHLYDDMDVILVDKLLSTKTLLNQNPSYAFTSEASDPENRFELRFRTAEDPTNAEEPPRPENQLWVYENRLHVVNNENMARLEVLDISGRTLRQYVANSGRHSYDLGLAEGTYVIRMTTATGVQTIKAVIH